RASSTPRDRVLRLARAVRAAAERSQLLGEQHCLVPVGPGDEHGLVAEELHPHRLLRLLWERRVAVCASARVAGTRAPDRAVRDDAVVAVAPLDAERVA